MLYSIGELKMLDKNEVGGKASSLNTLKYHGLPVPNGIILNDEYFQTEDQISFVKKMDNKKRYAVRSSAIDEDGTKFSFAGMQDTYLNVSVSELEEMVDKCYQSQFSERAVSYRDSMGLPPSKGMAVVVQEMVHADIAGVVFTQNPLNNRLDEMLIEIVEGLGEGLVSGQETPTTYTINRKLGNVKSVNVHGQTLSERLIQDVVAYADEIEKLFNVSQDIEFALKDGKVYILQARPITTVTKVPIQMRDGNRLYISFGHIQNMTYPFTPIGAEMICKMFSYQNHPFLKGRLLYNEEFLFADITEMVKTPSVIFKKVEKVLGYINFELPEIAREFRKIETKRSVPPAFMLKVVGKMLQKVWNLSRKEPSAVPMLKFLDNHLETYKEYEEIELMKNQSNIIFPIFKFCLPYLLLGMLSFLHVKNLFEKYGLNMEDFHKLIAGATGNVTTEMGLLYDDVLLNVGTEKGEALFREYVEKYGMRVDGEIDLGRARPCEDIDSFKVRTFALAKEHSGISLRVEHQNKAKEADAIIQKLNDELSAKQYKKISKWIDYMLGYFVLREHPKYYLIRVFNEYRKLINTPFMTFAEQYGCKAENSVLIERKKMYDEAFQKKPPLAMCQNGLILKPSNQSFADGIRGYGVSSGTVTGKVRVISNMGDDVVREGEILVTHFTDPGWTPMMAKACGFVIEVGGMMTHGAIVAREYGIPAVVGLENAVNRFRTGDVIKMNGGTGEIEIISRVDGDKEEV